MRGSRDCPIDYTNRWSSPSPNPAGGNNVCPQGLSLTSGLLKWQILQCNSSRHAIEAAAPACYQCPPTAASDHVRFERPRDATAMRVAPEDGIEAGSDHTKGLPLLPTHSRPLDRNLHSCPALLIALSSVVTLLPSLLSGFQCSPISIILHCYRLASV